MFEITTAALLIAMGMGMVRALMGPTVYDRVLALNNLGTKTVLLIAVLGFLTHRPDFLDLALIYALINFIGTIAVLKYFEYGDLGAESPRHVDPVEAGEA
ncbi:MAG: monovalent cation/H+ antiporter complex subunit F [Longimicrobiales bacterium]